MTYYEILEISEKASDEVIKMAYKALAKKYHPDLFVGDTCFAEEKMKQINEAYSVLSNPGKRAAYDSFLNEKNKEKSQKTQQEKNQKTEEQSDDEKVEQPKKAGIFRNSLLFIAVLISLFLIIYPAIKPIDIETIKDSVVMINVYDSFDDVISTGSGFCAFDSNYIVTNYHVIEGAARIEFITDDGMRHTVTEVSILSKNNDLAILKTIYELNPLSISKNKNLKLGDDVVAISSPKGQLNTVSTGIISNIDDDYQIRTTAPISPGSSGGVLLDKKLNVIGITYATYNSSSAQNLNYAINITYLTDMYKALQNEKFEAISEENYKNYTVRFSSIEKIIGYYSVEKVDLLGKLLGNNRIVYTDIEGVKYDLSDYDNCVIVRTVTLEDKLLAELLYTQLTRKEIYSISNFDKKTHEREVINTMNGIGASQGGGKGHIVTPGMYVEAVDKWCFDKERKEGDIELIKNEYGYSICYISFVHKNK